MYDLLVACAVFLVLHLGVSGTCLRGEIIRLTGEKAYMGLFALAVLASMVWIVRAYPVAYGCQANAFFPPAGEIYRGLALPVIGFAFLLGLPGMMMKNPTSAQQEGAPLQGVERITRHPFLWGAAIWAAYHLIGAGDVASATIFLTMLILSIGGTFSIDAKCRHRLGPEKWAALAAISSNLPFAALLQGRNKVSLTGFCREYGLVRCVATLVIFALLLGFHAQLFGVLPLPAGWIFW